MHKVSMEGNEGNKHLDTNRTNDANLEPQKDKGQNRRKQR
jgi:hypothetical protein